MMKKEDFQRVFRKILQFLIYVIFEWLLILILFIDGLFAFAANELARFFGLKMPCLLCTRLDHLLVRRKPDFYYNDSICEGHRKDVSSLAYCHVHKRLSDIRWMCEGCLLSFATENKSTREIYRSLVGVLGADLECTVEDDHKIHLKLPAISKKDQLLFEKSATHRCSCCGEPLRVRSSYPLPLPVPQVQSQGSLPLPQGQGQGQGQVQASNATTNFPQAPTPSPRILPTTTSKMEELRSFDPLPHMRYTEIKFSDTESEMPEDDESTVKEDQKTASVPLMSECEDNEELCKTPSYIRANRLLNFALGTDSTTVTPRSHDKPFRKLLAEKAEGAVEQLELSSEGDGDSIMLQMKKQVRLDRKSLIALYMELDEERAASAVAANQAMAMITRLQAEKAAMQMEALQYQRMMEEQAEYDQEAIQVLKDLLVKRDEELKALDAEVKSCKQRLGEDVLDIDYCKTRFDDDYQKLKLFSNASISQISECSTPPPNYYDDDGNDEDYKRNTFQSKTPLDDFGSVIEEPLIDQECEKSYLLERLRALEMVHASMYDAHSDKLSEDINNLEEECKGDGGNNIIAREMTHLTKRLEAIENDREFLKHAFQSLQKGEEGTQLLREIARHLRELRHLEK